VEGQQILGLDGHDHERDGLYPNLYHLVRAFLPKRRRSQGVEGVPSHLDLVEVAYPSSWREDNVHRVMVAVGGGPAGNVGVDKMPGRVLVLVPARDNRRNVPVNELAVNSLLVAET